MDRGGDDGDDGPTTPIVPPPPLTAAERACDVGDLLEVIASFEGQAWNDAEPTRTKPSGQIYRAMRLVSHGWDLELVCGDAPKEVRIMNWDIESYFRVLPRCEAENDA